MCGIIAGISTADVIEDLLAGLVKLEYRGYDSAGIAVINDQQQLKTCKAIGRVATLQQDVRTSAMNGNIGIGHTRWATHGVVDLLNAHPQLSHDRLAVVHNGIVENYAILKPALLDQNYNFASETDTEIIAHLIHLHYCHTNDILQATLQTIQQLQGHSAFVFLDKTVPQQLICVQLGAPLLIGFASDAVYCTSDALAFPCHVQKILYLEIGDIAQITLQSCQIWHANANGQLELIQRDTVSLPISAQTALLETHQYYMHQEIWQQPQSLDATLQYINGSFSGSAELNPAIFGEAAPEMFNTITKIQIIACGSSLHAGLVAKSWLEHYAQLECAVDIASEYRYSNLAFRDNLLVVSISQSGETADTLAAQQYAKVHGITNILAISNVAASSIVRAAKFNFITQAGPEIGVASSKSFTAQLLALLYLSFSIAASKNLSIDYRSFNAALSSLPALVTDMLHIEVRIQQLAIQFQHVHHALFLSRGMLLPIALEGSLKLKELSYIHAECYAAGELKHGALALIDNDMPVFVLSSQQTLEAKITSNTQEVLARRGKVYLITDNIHHELHNRCAASILLPIAATVPSYLLPILFSIPMQLLAYHIALIRHADIDKPRNLAKSVTVE